MMSPDRLRAFLHDVQRGALTRAGYARVYLSWLGQPATKAQKADAEAALRLGLLAWPGMTPGTAATLSDSGRALVTLDAARYQWLRDSENPEAPRLVATYGGADLDAAIDRAKQAEQEWRA